MGTETISFVVPVIRTRKGRLEAGQTVTFKKPCEAERRAERIAQAQPGAFVYERTGDPDFGEYSEPLLVKSYGEVPTSILSSVVPVIY